MSQPVNSSRLTNSAVNINGSTSIISTNYGLTSIGVTGNNLDISALSTGNIITIGANGTRNVTIGSAASGTVTFPGVTTFTQPVSGGTFSAAAINGTGSSSAMTIGGNLTAGSVSIANTGSATTVTLGNNGGSAIGTVNVGVSSATVNVGTTTNTAVVLGKAGGTVTLGPALTLGAAPTSGLTNQLGSYFISAKTAYALGSGASTSGYSPLGTISMSSNGIYLISVYVICTLSGSAGVFGYVINPNLPTTQDNTNPGYIAFSTTAGTGSPYFQSCNFTYVAAVTTGSYSQIIQCWTNPSQSANITNFNMAYSVLRIA